jgi:hypothetical protein
MMAGWQRGLRLLLLCLAMFAVVIFSSVIESQSAKRLGLMKSYSTIFSLDDSLADIKTTDDLFDYLRHVSSQVPRTHSNTYPSSFPPTHPSSLPASLEIIMPRAFHAGALSSPATSPCCLSRLITSPIPRRRASSSLFPPTTLWSKAESSRCSKASGRDLRVSAVLRACTCDWRVRGC